MLRVTRKSLVWMTMAALLAIVSGELFARYCLGLGAPLLSVAHPTIEYMLKPNQDLYKFGNHIIVNRYGMRTVPFALRKADGELRIMVFGDSVVNGGNQTDHAALATTMLQEKLSEGHRKVVVGNISAGSWGPGNWLAYAREFGFFGADIVVLVISSHDYADNPTFGALSDITHPTKNPISALYEGITRYLPRYLPKIGLGGEISEADRFPDGIGEQEALRALDDLKEFLKLAIASSARVFVFQHWEAEEVERGVPDPGNQRIRVVCESMGVLPISLEPYFRQSLGNASGPYRDNIHPNQIGQKVIANALLKHLPISDRWVE